MSEFERTPESMKAELGEIDTKLAELNQRLSELPEGDYEETGSLEEFNEITTQATKAKKELYSLLVALQDKGEIERRLGETTQEALELYGDEGMPVYKEIILEDTFAISTGDEVSPIVKTTIDELTETYGLMSFEDEEPEE